MKIYSNPSKVFVSDCCGVPYARNIYKYQGKIFPYKVCTKCRQKCQVRYPEVNCVICSKTFLKGDPRQMTCSKECAHIRQLCKIKQWREDNPELYRAQKIRHYTKHHPKVKSIICQECGEVKPSDRRKKYCTKCAKIRRNRLNIARNAIWQKTKGLEIHRKASRESARRKRKEFLLRNNINR